MDIAVIGLGKLGSPLAAVLAARGHRVIGVDINPALVEAINAHRAPVVEPGLQRCMDEAGRRLSATTDFGTAISQTDISFIIVPTPSVDGVFSNRFVVDAVRRIGNALKRTDRYHVVNVTSTVMPGSTGGEIRKALEEASGQRVGETIGLTYNPEFIALGSVVRDLLRPDLLLIGESDKRAGDLLEAVYRKTLDPVPPIRRMNWVNAELAKISVNTFVTTKISYANMLAEICEQLPGADVDVVTAALGEDSRIGRKYLRAALGYGGPCFPRDNAAFAGLARRLGAAAEIAEATDAINRRQVHRIVALVRRLSGPTSSVAVLGLSYKPQTPVIEESQGVMIARSLAQAGYTVLAADPLALETASSVLGESVLPIATPEAAIGTADIVVIATPAPEFAELPPDAFTAGGRRRTVIDCWRVLPTKLASVADIVYIGRGEPDSAAEQ
jgi:UDPglucose 6-dehydrogenase